MCCALSSCPSASRCRKLPSPPTIAGPERRAHLLLDCRQLLAARAKTGHAQYAPPSHPPLCLPTPVFHPGVHEPRSGRKTCTGGGERGAEDAAREGLEPDMKAAWLAARTAVAAQEYVHGTVAAAQCQQTNRGRLLRGGGERREGQGSRGATLKNSFGGHDDGLVGSQDRGGSS